MSLKMATVGIVLMPRKNKKGEYPIALRITYDRERKYYTVRGESATKEEYQKILESSRGERAKRKRKFEDIKKNAEKTIEGLAEFSFEEFEGNYLGKKQQRELSIDEYFEKKATELQQNDKLQTATTYRATIRSLKRFDSRVSFNSITPTYLKKYENWFVTEGKTPQKKDAPKQGGSYTTVGIYMRNLKAILNIAIKDGVAIKYPFGTDKGLYQIPVSNNTKKALTIQDIGKLFSYSTADKNENTALKYWMFSYLCNGMNPADMANLRFSNIRGKNIEFIRQKTKDTTKVKTVIKVLINEHIQRIIDEIGNTPDPDSYLFPIYQEDYTEREKFNRLKQFIKLTNKYIRRVAGKVGVDAGITMYWARHSYSTILKRSGAPIEFISEQLGHQNTATTQNYLDSFENEHRAKYSEALMPDLNDE
ncbi:tyrosine-type recombinase/integrase [Draconibacterium halophilum]|uniref:Site-specific integrase n=1 Tax=Draconibacterium halophilum TaxID=2706887 RepID=A0A6C0R9F1_9BACT|nr:site-specific integrase [Draconibacterium halophilum]QIA07118.1 site-specific integrase [Draconibacterium halophilum]